MTWLWNEAVNRIEVSIVAGCWPLMQALREQSSPIAELLRVTSVPLTWRTEILAPLAYAELFTE